MLNTTLSFLHGLRLGRKDRSRSKEAMTALESFETSRIAIQSTYPPGEVRLFVRTKGSGEGLLLLHGYPQTGRYVSSLTCLSLLSLIRSLDNILASFVYTSARSCSELISRMWHKIANQLAERYAVVIPDLRGMSHPQPKSLRRKDWKSNR